MRIRLTYILLLLTILSNAQGFKLRHKVSNASGNSAKAFFEMSPGNYIGAGFAVDTSSGFPVNRIALMGINSAGQVIWTKKYGDYKMEHLENGFIQRCFYKQNNYLYHAGCIRDSLGASIGSFTKFDQNGDTLWRKFYRDSTSIDLIPQMVTSSVDGGFLITGFFQNWITNTRQGLILKTDANGNELWRKKLNKSGTNVQDGKAIIQDSATKKIVIVGYQYLAGFAHYDNILILDSLGVKITQGAFCGQGGNATDLIQTKDKKFVMVGWQYYNQLVGSNNCMRAFAIKFDVNDPFNPVPIWKINGHDRLALENGFTCVRELSNGDILIGGFVDTTQGVWNGPNNLPANIFTRFTIVDKDGNIKSNRYYNYRPNNSHNLQGLRSVELCQDGSWLGAIEGFNYGVNPHLFVKYDATGCDSTAAHCATLNLVGIKEAAENDPGIKIYPNPADDFLNIESLTGGEIQVSIADISGIEVKKIKVTSKDKIDLSELNNGMYVITLTREKKIIHKEKLIKH